jgi:hypothetical protein
MLAEAVRSVRGKETLAQGARDRSSGLRLLAVWRALAIPEDELFNPDVHLPNILARELLCAREAHAFSADAPDLPGVYALFYNGPSPLYRPISSPDWLVPIYIGSTDGSLAQRLGNHLESIKAGAGIEPDQFRYRFLQLSPDRHRGIERLLTEWFNPVWNGTGFGAKVHGVHREGQETSLWDTWHPGRIGRGGLARPAPAAKLALERRLQRSLDAMHQALGDDWDRP